jgi:hypothetical protein
MNPAPFVMELLLELEWCAVEVAVDNVMPGGGGRAAAATASLEVVDVSVIMEAVVVIELFVRIGIGSQIYSYLLHARCTI